jgi:hypothetical protein
MPCFTNGLIKLACDLDSRKGHGIGIGIRTETPSVRSNVFVKLPVHDSVQASFERKGYTSPNLRRPILPNNHSKSSQTPDRAK